MKDTELKLLRDKCLLFNQFMIEKSLIPPELVEAYNESNKLIEKTYREKKIKPLKIMSVDIDDQVIRHMPLSMAIEFKSYLKEKLNIDYNVTNKKRKKTIDNILKRGKISNREEYEVVINRVDEIFADPTNAEELKSLNELLTIYDME